MSPAELYRELCEYLARNGWQREDVDSAWWFSPEEPETIFGAAVDAQLRKDGIDTRDGPT